MYQTTQTFKSDFFGLVTLDDFDLTHGHTRLRMVFRSMPKTIDAISATLSQSDTAALPGEASDDR